ncbi:XamI restriction endonuclease [Rhizobium sp. PP-WC-1G-195]|nr:XamI restriction endonuclease [Rhizobium sp. PP-WC-1G-195]
MNLLLSMGWERKQARLIADLTVVAPKTFMQKTRFATKTRPQEVDVACGLKGTTVAAIECKVTNDQTNSVKRINDVLKKANAWHNHWGSFVETVAVLQGVIKAADVERLSEANVHVFWSHDLDALREWLALKV